VLLAALAACGPVPPRSARALIPAPPRLAPFAVTELAWTPGETLQWDVRLNAIDLGRVELVTEDDEVTSTFRTNQLASLLGATHHELVTQVVDHHVVASHETLELGGETTAVSARFDGPRLTVDENTRTIPGGNLAQTLHTTLAWLRAWARADAEPGFLFVLHMGELYRLDVERPVPDERRGELALRITARAGVYGSKDDPVSLVLWLRDAPDRTPLEMRLASGELVVTARLRQ